MTGRRRVAALTAVLLVGASCGGGGGKATVGAPLPSPPPIVTVTMDEYRFQHPVPVPVGRVVFRFVNEGDLPHQPDLLPLADNLPPIDEQLRGEERAVVTPFAGVPPRDPGQVGTFAVDLVAGQRYALICFARDPDDDESHALQGMSSEFRPGAAPATTSPPTTSG